MFRTTIRTLLVLALGAGLLSAVTGAGGTMAPAAASTARAAGPTCSGTLPTGAVVALAATPDDGGYWIVDGAGTVVACGDAGTYGSLTTSLRQPIVGMAATADGHGYWMVAADGGVFAFGDAGFRGSAGNLVLNRPVVGMAVDAATGGYWLVAADGGVFAYDAPFSGSAGNLVLNRPVTGMASSPAGAGYWLVASDGGIFAYGVPFHGSMGGETLNRPVVSVAADPATDGYWMVASDGGVFAFDAPFVGSTGSTALTNPIVGMESSTTGTGYRFVAGSGDVFAFGTSRFLGSSAPPGAWLSPSLTITPRSLGAVQVGMTFDQAQTAAGVPFPLFHGGDGFNGPVGQPANPNLFIQGGPGIPVSCVGAVVSPFAPGTGLSPGQTISTPEGFQLGGTVSQLTSIYGGRLQYVPMPTTGGYSPEAGYVVAEATGNLAFVLDPGGTTIVGIHGGPGVVPSTCDG